jgi:hypothetical protein
VTTRRTGQAAALHLFAAIVIGALAWLGHPKIHSVGQHDKFIDFYVASASVIAALLVALAIEARSVASTIPYALAIATMLAVGAVCAIVALSPHLPESWIYNALFALTVGCGVSGLVAVVDASVRLLSVDLSAVSAAEMTELQRRRDLDRRELDLLRREQGPGGV